MSPRYLRNAPGRRENLAAAVLSGALAVGVGVAAFYLTRLVLAREPVARAGEVESKRVVRTSP